jgi:hypothetical protein
MKCRYLFPKKFLSDLVHSYRGLYMINVFAFDLQCNRNADDNGLPEDSSKHTKRTGATEDMPTTPI